MAWPLFLTQTNGRALLQSSSSHSPALRVKLKLKVSFLNWYLLISNQNIPYTASKSILVLPINVSAVFGFMAIWAPRGPILILSQIVPIGPSVKNQHIWWISPFLMSIVILKGVQDYFQESSCSTSVSPIHILSTPSAIRSTKALFSFPFKPWFIGAVSLPFWPP